MHKVPPLLIWLLAGMLVGAFVNRYSSGTFVERIGMTLLIVASCVITLAAVNFLRTRRRAPNSSAPTQTESVTETPLNILLFAIIPPFLVILDRWFDNPTAAELFKPAWCKVDWLCHLALPPYFVLVFVCMLVVFALVWTDVPNWMSKMIQGQDQELPDADLTIVPSSQRRRRPILRISALVGIVFLIARQVIFGSPPGWEYAILCFLYFSSWAGPDISMAKIMRAGQQYGRTIVMCVIAHLALLSTLENYFTTRELNMFSAGLFLLAGMGLVWYRRRIHPLFWVISLALVIYTICIDAWVFSDIGDEFSFYRYALQTHFGLRQTQQMGMHGLSC